MGKKYKIFDKHLEHWLRWGYPNNTPHVPIVGTSEEASASLFTEVEVQKLKDATPCVVDPTERFDFIEVTD